MNKKNTKQALLSSVIALLLCVSMLVGTTFAWFTDSVTSGNNNIIAGNLDVELYDTDGEKVDNRTDLFEEVELWEPGVVVWENLTVANVGTLALKYQLAINFLNENWIIEGGYKLSQVLKVAVVPEIDKAADRETVLDAAKDAEGALLSNFVLSGELTPDVKESETYGLVIYWEPSADDNNWNENNDKATNDGEPLHIDLGIDLIATQLDYEGDSFGKDYDEGLTFGPTSISAEELWTALSANEDVSLAGDVDLAGYDWTQVATYSGTFNGNGYSILNYTDDLPMFAALDGATVRDLTFENANVTNTSEYYIAVLAGQTSKTQNVNVIDNVTVYGSVTAASSSYYVGGIIGADNAYSSEISNCTNYANIFGGQSVGGIAGYTVREAKISGCKNYGEISGSLLVGGIVGFVALDEANDTLVATISDCSNFANVTATGMGVPQFVGSNGGIVGNVGRSSGKATTKMMYAYINDCDVLDGQKIYGTAGNYVTPSSGPEALITVVIDGVSA